MNRRLIVPVDCDVPADRHTPTDGVRLKVIAHPTLTPMADAVWKREGHVIVENRETGQYEDFENIVEFVDYYVAKLKAINASHQRISGFKRTWKKRYGAMREKP